MIVYVLSSFLSKWARVKRSTWNCVRMQISTSKQVVLETISWTFNGIQRVTYVTWAAS